MTRETLLLNAARFGYGARGAVYLLTGVLAMLAAIEMRATTSGMEGALAQAGDWPLGRLWLIAAAAGLICFSGWSLIQMIFDPERRGMFGRLANTVDALVNLGLAFTALQLLDAFGDLNEEAEARQDAALVLALPFGDWLLWGVAGAVLIGGFSNIWKATTADFRRGVVCPPRLRPLVEFSGRFGHMALGLVLILLAVFLAVAAHDQDPSAAKSVAGALQSLERSPFGSTMLATLGAGFVMFGLYGLLEAGFRRLCAPEELT